MPNIVLLALKVVTVEFPDFSWRQVETRSPSYSPWILMILKEVTWFELMSLESCDAPQTR